MIQISQIIKDYNGLVVLNIPELTIQSGESFGLVGNNGAGKTTFFRLLLDLTEPFQGKICIDGEPVARHEEWKNKTSSFLDEGSLIDFLTPEEYFDFIGKLYGKNKEDIDLFLQEMEEIFNGEILGQKKLIREYSKGNQKKIGIAAALLSNPQIVVLDEPFTALDPTSQIRLKRFLIELQKKKEITMLISSHDLNHIAEVCNRIVVLEKGQIVKDIQRSEDTLKNLEGYFNI